MHGPSPHLKIFWGGPSPQSPRSPPPNLVSNRAINWVSQLGPVSITKLSPNWACQIGPIHFIKFLLSGLRVIVGCLLTISKVILTYFAPEILNRTHIL